jgi:hypothetical protein
MMAVFWLVFGVGLGVLAVAAGVTLHGRRRSRYGGDTPIVDDHVLEQILERGEVFVEHDEPLDLDEIDDEEERFWSESWDEPSSEWGAP